VKEAKILGHGEGRGEPARCVGFDRGNFEAAGVYSRP
jgi:hypothetical protein